MVLGTKVSVNQPCALAAANFKHILGRKQESRQQAEVIIPPYSVRPYLKYYVQSGAPQYKTDIDCFGVSLAEDHKIAKGLQQGNVNRAGMSSFRKSSSRCLQIPNGKVKRRQSQTTFRGAQRKDKRQWT